MGHDFPAIGGSYTLEELDALGKSEHDKREAAKQREIEEHKKRKAHRPHSPIDHPVEDEPAPPAAAPASKAKSE